MLAFLSMPQFKGIISVVFRALLSLLVAGVVIGYLHRYDIVLGVALLLVLLSRLWKMPPLLFANRRFLLWGVVLTAIVGTMAEWWGIYCHHWVYHDLSGTRRFPLWLPSAWALSFLFINRIKDRLCIIFEVSPSDTTTLFLMNIAVSVIFPTFGEMVAINMGVWHYNWPLQLLGVPLLAIALLAVAHSGIFLMANKLSLSGMQRHINLA